MLRARSLPASLLASSTGRPLFWFLPQKVVVETRQRQEEDWTEYYSDDEDDDESLRGLDFVEDRRE